MKIRNLENSFKRMGRKKKTGTCSKKMVERKTRIKVVYSQPFLLHRVRLTAQSDGGTFERSATRGKKNTKHSDEDVEKAAL